MGLRRAMLKNNVKRNAAFIYHDIQYVNGQWVAWFHDVVTPDDVRELDAPIASNNR
jgi:hypothetical protein